MIYKSVVVLACLQAAAGFAPVAPVRRAGFAPVQRVFAPLQMSSYLDSVGDDAAPKVEPEPTPEPVVAEVAVPEPVVEVAEPEPELPVVALSTPSAPAGEPAGALVKVTPENVEASAGVIGGAAGLVLAGLPAAAALGLVANYVSKLDNDAGSAVRQVSEAGIKTYNAATTANDKFKITDKVGSAIESAVEAAKEKDTTDDKIVTKGFNFVNSFVDKVKELNQDFDIVGNAKELLFAAGELGGKAIDKALELNDQYQVTAKIADKVKDTSEQLKSKINN